jgi:hypothetical protein
VPAKQVEEIKKKAEVVNPDDLPIGGKKIEFSEFPEEG